ncbi:MAG: carboxylating nicotinate-nucleotide diphosphorylase [Candidatus Omnitrophica bacterium]|nr:carboxylating nicotinate-nucleotide diphosphorylase [Candidatus Omnitrophota bacterium]
MKPWALNQLIRRALSEDAANNDITTNSLIPKHHVSQATIIIKEDAVVCGLKIVERIFKLLDSRIRFETMHPDGTKVKRNTIVAKLKGKTRAILTGERVALNFLGYLSGIGTDTNKFIAKTRHTKVKILDTRKTTPGLRILEKRAVKCGGGHNHRPDLSELVLIKDNHRGACHPHLSIPEAIKRARRKTKKTIEIEVDTLAQFKEALLAEPDMILLDNMNCAQMKKAVAIVKELPLRRRPILEASGGITLRNVAQVAHTGVDCISIGSLTHSHNGIDVSLEIVN